MFDIVREAIGCTSSTSRTKLNIFFISIHEFLTVYINPSVYINGGLVADINRGLEQRRNLFFAYKTKENLFVI